MNENCSKPKVDCGFKTSLTMKNEATSTQTHTKNRVSVLSVGGSNIVINSRVRRFSLTTKEKNWISTNASILFDPVNAGAITGCFENFSNDLASISDDYETIDTTIKFVDLRNDTVVYEEVTKKQVYADSVAFLIPFKDPYGFTYSFPFVLTRIPIQITTKIVLYVKGEKTVLNSDVGFFNTDGFSFLTRLGPQQQPIGAYFTLSASEFRPDGNTFRDSEVDWYTPWLTAAEDGGTDLYYPSWIKIVGNDGKLDAKEAYDRYTKVGNPVWTYSTTSMDNMNTSTVFYGSVAFDACGNMFYSVDADGTPVSELRIDGESVDIPQETVRNKVYDGDSQLLDANGNAVWTDPQKSECDLWYPISPL